MNLTTVPVIEGCPRNSAGGRTSDGITSAWSTIRGRYTVYRTAMTSISMPVGTARSATSTAVRAG